MAKKTKMGAPLRFPPPTGNPARDHLIDLRRRLNLSQAALGEKLGIAYQSVQAWENGQTTPSGPALKLLEQLEDSLGNQAASAPAGQQKRRSVGERLKKAKSTAAKREVALEWARDWGYEQKEITARLKRAMETGAGDFLARALRDLEAVTDKCLGALPRVIELLLEGVEDEVGPA